MDDHDESSREWLEHILLFVTCGQVDRENILWGAHCKEGKHSLAAESGHGFWNVSDACFKITKEPNKSRNGQPAHWDKHGTQPSPVRASPWKKIAFYHIVYSRVNDIIYHSSLPWWVVQGWRASFLAYTGASLHPCCPQTCFAFRPKLSCWRCHRLCSSYSSWVGERRDGNHWLVLFLAPPMFWRLPSCRAGQDLYKSLVAYPMTFGHLNIRRSNSFWAWSMIFYEINNRFIRSHSYLPGSISLNRKC